MMSSSTSADEPVKKLEEMERRLNAFSRWKDQANERIDALEAENEALRARLQESRSGKRPEKKTVAKQLARNELLRQLGKKVKRDHRSGQVSAKETSSVDVPTVQEQAKGRGRDLRYNTARAGLEELTAEWECFEWKDGSGKPTGENNRVRKIAAEDVPEPLWRLYHEDTRDETDDEVDDPPTKSVVSTTQRGGR